MFETNANLGVSEGNGFRNLNVQRVKSTAREREREGVQPEPTSRVLKPDWAPAKTNMMKLEHDPLGLS